MQHKTVSGLAFIIALSALPLDAQSTGKRVARTRSASPAVADQVIIGLAPGANLQPILTQTESSVLGSIPGTGIYLLRAGTGRRVSTVVTQLEEAAEIEFVERNRVTASPEARGCTAGPLPGAQPCTVAMVDGTPTAQEYYGQNAVAKLNVPAAQSYLTGRPAVVAVIDTGLDLGHPLFQGRLFSLGYDYVRARPLAMDVANGRDDDGDGLADEAYGHGTHVAGTILLINPQALILPQRVLDSEGNGSAFDVATAICDAVNDGAQVINLSLSMTSGSEAVRRALEHAENAGVAVLSSAGNTGRQGVLFPARYESVLAVASVDDFDVRSVFSAYGAPADVSAPGEFIYSAMPDGQWAWWSGTSMACAVASGVASLTLSATSASNQFEVRDPLVDSSVSIIPQNPIYGALLGEGRVEALGAVLEVIE